MHIYNVTVEKIKDHLDFRIIFDVVTDFRRIVDDTAARLFAFRFESFIAVLLLHLFHKSVVLLYVLRNSGFTEIAFCFAVKPRFYI